MSSGGTLGRQGVGEQRTAHRGAGFTRDGLVGMWVTDDSTAGLAGHTSGRPMGRPLSSGTLISRPSASSGIHRASANQRFWDFSAWGAILQEAIAYLAGNEWAVHIFGPLASSGCNPDALPSPEEVLHRRAYRVTVKWARPIGIDFLISGLRNSTYTSNRPGHQLLPRANPGMLSVRTVRSLAATKRDSFERGW